MEPVQNAVSVGTEGPVPDEFGVETTVIRVVDFFRHQAVEVRAHGGFRMIQVDGQRGRRCARTTAAVAATRNANSGEKRSFMSNILESGGGKSSS